MAFIRLNRKLFDHFLWKENRKYSRAEAWIDLIQLMSYTKNPKERQKLINGVWVKWDRGQYPVSYSFLSQRWDWSVHKVRIFIELLKSEKQVSTQTTNITTILTLCNYDFYNPMSQAEEQAEGMSDGKQTAGSKERKESEEGKTKKENFIKEKTWEEESLERIRREDREMLDRRIAVLLATPDEEEPKQIVPKGF
jgi:hypothetical protein